MTQVHDFNGGIGGNGLFWTVELPDDAVTVTDDMVTIAVKNVAVVDQLTFPNTAPDGAIVNLGNFGAPATVSFNITYLKSGRARHVRPISRDPLNPFNWAGEMSDATNSGTFSVAYTDGSFSAQGSFSSQGNFGEIGRERNGSFVRHEDEDEGNQGENGQAAAALQSERQASTHEAVAQPSASAKPSASAPKFRGKVPVEAFVH
jgi:hypothetical protein